jgi:toxin CptA
MHSAPSVSYPVGRSRFAGLVLLVFWLLGAAAIAAWWLQAQAPGWRTAAAVLLLAMSGLIAVIAWRRSPIGELAWDGENWNFSGAAESSAAALSVALDLQRRLLVHWVAPGASCWLWLERTSRPERWDDVRRAVYSRARPQAQSAAGT